MHIFSIFGYYVGILNTPNGDNSHVYATANTRTEVINSLFVKAQLI